MEKALVVTLSNSCIQDKVFRLFYRYVELQLSQRTLKSLRKNNMYKIFYGCPKVYRLFYSHPLVKFVGKFQIQIVHSSFSRKRACAFGGVYCCRNLFNYSEQMELGRKISY